MITSKCTPDSKHFKPPLVQEEEKRYSKKIRQKTHLGFCSWNVRVLKLVTNAGRIKLNGGKKVNKRKRRIQN